MSDEDRKAIEQLERRVATLENMVRRLTFIAGGAEPARPKPIVRASMAIAPEPVLPPAAPAERATDLEQWFGQRGLLAVGVAALLIAAAFFLKYAFDRGWISPLLRAIGAVVLGAGVAAWGHERIGHGMRRYGAALIGAGGGLVFLGLWAAAGPYALIERRVGILLLALTTVGVTLLALHHEIEWLALWALAGAYLAPITLPPPVPNPDAFLGYLEVVGLGTGILAYVMSWRRTFDLALFGYLLLASAGAAAALATPAGCWLLAAGALLTLHVTVRRPWGEARLGVLALAWLMLGASFIRLNDADGARWLALGALFAVNGFLFRQHVERDPFRVRSPETTIDQLLFLFAPAAFVLLALASGVALVEREPAVIPAALAVVYLAAGWTRRGAALVIMGFAIAALAIAIEWAAEPWAVSIGWTGLALVALLVERSGARPGGLHAATGLAIMAFAWLFSAALAAREDLVVFADPWALALYAYVAATALATQWWENVDVRRNWLWVLCGAAVFLGGSIQVWRAFAQITRLWADLALSVWWLGFAGALVWLGFHRDRKAVRSAGLGVAAAAGLKIVFYDLSALEALYRVGSFLALALIALAVAYAYNKRAKASAA